MTRGVVALACACVAGCGGSSAVVDAAVDVAVDGAPVDDGRTTVANVRAAVNPNVDILWVIDDSPGVLGLQTSLKNDFPNFVNVLNGLEGGLPTVHIGVVSPDLGTRGTDGGIAPGTGTGPGACSQNGKAGNLQTNNTPALGGSVFISDSRNTDGTRSKNYTGDLASAFAAIASLGASGCEFEQPLEAARRALNNNPANAGFRRQTALLALLFVTNEDDCSLAHSTLLGSDVSTLGPLSSFRCTRFGVTCSSGGPTPNEMNKVGGKGGCKSNDASPYLTTIPEYTTFLSNLTITTDNLFVGTLAAPSTPVSVEQDSTGALALAHSCTWVDQSTAMSVGDPPVRLTQLAASVPNHVIANGCSQDVSDSMVAFARAIGLRIGDPCIRYGAQQLVDCIATETAGAMSTVLPACDATMTKPCWRIASDPVACATGAHNKLVVDRAEAPRPDSVVTLRCFTPF